MEWHILYLLDVVSRLVSFLMMAYREVIGFDKMCCMEG